MVMGTITVIGSALALSMDNFAVAAVVTASMSRPTAWRTFRLTATFGVFQAIMTAIGVWGGANVASIVGGVSSWIAFGLLMLLGINMLRENAEDEVSEGRDPTSGLRIVGLALATSVDSLVAGVSLSLMGSETWMLAPIFGVTAALMAFVGTIVGKQAGLHLAEWPQRFGGFILIAIAVRGLAQSLISS